MADLFIRAIDQVAASVHALEEQKLAVASWQGFHDGQRGRDHAVLLLPAMESVDQNLRKQGYCRYRRSHRVAVRRPDSV